MTRRTFLASSTFAAGLAPGWGQSRRVDYRVYARCLPDYLAALARQAYERRNRALAALITEKAIRARQQWVRQTFWNLTGGMPERTPLNVKTLGAFERGGYRVEKLLYESQPGLLIPANLYIPAGARPPLPGVLFQMGHSLNGKAAIPYQKCCQGLVKLGFLVLAFDPMGQGERTYYPRRDGPLTRLGSADTEHTLPGQQMLLVGDTATRMQAWDAVRSLDVLESHPLADKKRLASTGQSGGGTLTMLLAAVDERLAAAAVSCGNTENFAGAGFNPPGSTDDAEQNFIGAGPLGFDRWDLLYPLAPKPLLVISSAKDFFGTYSPEYISSGREEFGRLQRVYRTLGKEECIEWVETPLPHSLAYYPRVEIYNWFRRWLQGELKPVAEEPPVREEKDETLWVAPTGSVVRSFGSVRPAETARKRIPPSAGSVSTAKLRELLGMESRNVPGKLRSLGRAPSAGCEIEAVEVQSAEQVWAPAWIFHPRKPAGSGVLLILEPAGRNARWNEEALYQDLARRGVTVCAVDVRGIGDLRPEAGRGAPHYTLPHASEHNYAWASVMLGRSLLGQRVTDILAYVEALPGRPVRIAASGAMTVPATMAAALEARIGGLYLSGGLASYRSLIEAEEYAHTFANFVPNILLHTDLPEILKGLAPRPVVTATEWTAERLEAFSQSQ